MHDQKVGVIVQARMGSTRLPGKILKFLNGKERVLDVLIKRLKLSKATNDIIIATTPDVKNKAIIQAAKEFGVKYYVGDEENVLQRYFEAAQEYSLDIIVRVTSDCPFVDPSILDNMISLYKTNNYDYMRNVDTTTNFPRGFEFEIFSFKVLKKVFENAKTKPEKEHVTYYIYSHPELFRLHSYNDANLKKFNNLRLTIDEEQDFILCKKVYKRLKEKKKGINFTVYDIFEIIEESPELMNINKDIHQKKI